MPTPAQTLTLAFSRIFDMLRSPEEDDAVGPSTSVTRRPQCILTDAVVGGPRPANAPTVSPRGTHRGTSWHNSRKQRERPPGSEHLDSFGRGDPGAANAPRPAPRGTTPGDSSLSNNRPELERTRSSERLEQLERVEVRAGSLSDPPLEQFDRVELVQVGDHSTSAQSASVYSIHIPVAFETVSSHKPSEAFLTNSGGKESGENKGGHGSSSLSPVSDSYEVSPRKNASEKDDVRAARMLDATAAAGAARGRSSSPSRFVVGTSREGDTPGKIAWGTVQDI